MWCLQALLLLLGLQSFAMHRICIASLRYTVEFCMWLWVLPLTRAMRDRFLLSLGFKWRRCFFFQMLSFFVFPASCYIVCYAVRGNIGDVILYDFVTSFMKLLLSLLVYMVSCMVLFLVAFCCLSFFNLFSICLAKRENTMDIMANQCWKMQWNEVNMVNNRGNMRKQLWKKQRGNNPGGHCESGFPFFMSCRMKQHTTKRNQNAIKSNENIKPLKSA